MSKQPLYSLDRRAILAGAWRFFGQRFRLGRRYGLGFTIAFAATAMALWTFLEIVEGLTEHETLHHLDFRIREVVTRVVSPELTPWVVRITNAGSVPFTTGLVVLASVILLLRRQWWRMLELVFASAAGGLLVLALKGLFQRARPLERLVDAHGYSFPSGHAFGSMVFFGMLVRLAWISRMPLFGRISATLLCMLAILLIGISRVYLGVHWLTDILGGFTAGFIWLVASVIIIHLVEKRLPRRRAPGAGPGVGPVDAPAGEPARPPASDA